MGLLQLYSGLPMFRSSSGRSLSAGDLVLGVEGNQFGVSSHNGALGPTPYNPRFGEGLSSCYLQFAGSVNGELTLVCLVPVLGYKPPSALQSQTGVIY